MKFAVLDIEASGGKKGEEKIIEIAIYQFDGEKVTDQFASMVNPERDIDIYVQKLTNITPKMVRRAPKFHELAKRIIEITEDCIIVGHGVNFDYRMLKQEFKSLGYPYVRKTLDTLDLSQKLLPNIDSYSLGKLCKSLGIPVANRHRATGDTRATLELFKILLKKDSEKKILKDYAHADPKSKTQLNKLLKLQRALPQKSGVYYYLDSGGEVFYIKASKNIERSVNKDFIAKDKKSMLIQNRVDSVNFELTGNFYIALLKQMEDRLNNDHLLEEINQDYYKFGLFLNENEVRKIDEENDNPYWIFSSKNKAYKIQNQLNEAGWKVDKSYEEKAEILQGLKKINPVNNNFIIIDKGRIPEERSFIEIEGENILGYGFFKFYNQIENTHIRHNILIPISTQKITAALVRTFLNFHRFRKVITFKPGEDIKLPKENDRKKSKNNR